MGAGAGTGLREREMARIPVGIVGVGNCASSFLQGIEFYRSVDPGERTSVGLMHDDLCGYRTSDIQVVCAFDVESVSAYLMKHPPVQVADDLAKVQVERFLRGEIER